MDLTSASTGAAFRLKSRDNGFIVGNRSGAIKPDMTRYVKKKNSDKVKDAMKVLGAMLMWKSATWLWTAIRDMEL